MTAETEPAVPLRHSRMAALMPYPACRVAHCVVVGCGAVGRQTALLLAAAGVGRLTLFDRDRVGEENVGPQLFPLAHVGRRKSTAVADTCHGLVGLGDPAGPTIITDLSHHFTEESGETLVEMYRSMPSAQGMPLYFFSCADSMQARRTVFQAAKAADAAFFADARAAADVVRVLAVKTPGQDKEAAARYEESLFTDAEAFSGSCTTKMTGYMGYIAAGLLVAQFAKAVRGNPVTADQTLDLFAGELR